MDYYEVTVQSSDPYAYDILTAAFAEIGFESFESEDDQLKAYVPVKTFDQQLFSETCDYYQGIFNFEISLNKIPAQNWNALWESNFQPINVGNRVRVRAVFHNPDPSYPIELIIQPKMSFGTGHHATTWLVMHAMLTIDFSGKKVMDFGTGTGILAILANKLGASGVWAVDNDPQCAENAVENFELNNSMNIQMATGSINVFGNLKYDIIIGNITRNVIIEFLDDISIKLQDGGLFIASGFYDDDLPELILQARKSGLIFKKSNIKDKWCMAIFQK
jgi:ribosomal protein L11 methyltransferase